MLHEFLSSNRDELIRRCRSKVSKRDSPPVTALELEYGVPLFLDQLVETLRCEQDAPPGAEARWDSCRLDRDGGCDRKQPYRSLAWQGAAR